MKKNTLMIISAIFVISTFTSCQKEPVAKFSANKTNAKTGEEIAFTNESTDAGSYSWDFGDNNTSTEENPTHTYETAGSYIVELTVYSDNEKESDSYTQSISVIQANEFTYDDNKHELSKGYLVDYGVGEFDVYLVNDDITINSDLSANGTGDLVYFWMYSSSSTTLSEGSYTYSDTENDFTFYPESVVATNYNFANGTGTTFSPISGTVDIEKDGNEYTFDIELGLENGKTINGHYTGTLIYYDQSRKTTSKR